jgi:hypothetical protein
MPPSFLEKSSNIKFLKSEKKYQLSIMWFRILRVAFGAILVVLLITPFGVYHSISEPFIQGQLFGFNLPVGYIGALLGLLVFVCHILSFLKNRNFGSVLILVGLLLFLSFALFPPEFFVNLWYGTSFHSFQIDIDGSGGNILVIWISFFSIVAGLALRFVKNNSAPFCESC